MPFQEQDFTLVSLDVSFEREITLIVIIPFVLFPLFLSADVACVSKIQSVLSFSSE